MDSHLGDIILKKWLEKRTEAMCFAEVMAPDGSGPKHIRSNARALQSCMNSEAGTLLVQCHR